MLIGALFVACDASSAPGAGAPAVDRTTIDARPVDSRSDQTRGIEPPLEWNRRGPYAAYYGAPDTEWDIAIVCRPGRRVIELITLGVEAPPQVAAQTVTVDGVSARVPIRFDPDGMGSETGVVPLASPLVAALARARGSIAFSGTHGIATEVPTGAAVREVAAACLRSRPGEPDRAPHEPEAERGPDSAGAGQRGRVQEKFFGPVAGQLWASEEQAMLQAPVNLPI
ncbi:hypothetical protein GVO57_06345 [Sphingomonas changnyeongensis]|uniref:Uncharacterized protein n=1 Tax=Sphingomonas changnyeongensis TaxID=2698679 RepID=A0A7Z2NVE5_9SPHN|nr:hypothetical protein [Sphingomonas changnyeongensis]QHL90531.1 hypothetical protein GVO57_06345 [Sphingomonas changnyeongensis]